MPLINSKLQWSVNTKYCL